LTVIVISRLNRSLCPFDATLKRCYL